MEVVVVLSFHTFLLGKLMSLCKRRLGGCLSIKVCHCICVTAVVSAEVSDMQISRQPGPDSKFDGCSGM